MQPLLHNPPMKADECPIRYLTRISEHNGFLHFGYLLQHGGFSINGSRPPIKQLLEGSFNIHEYTDKLSLQVQNNSLKAMIGDFKPSFHHPALLNTSPKFCPKCMKEYGYDPNIWNILPIPVQIITVYCESCWLRE
ncbi:hypothetical protein TYM08_P3524 [Marinicellulosiphila megalodicopiae]